MRTKTSFGLIFGLFLCLWLLLGSWAWHRPNEIKNSTEGFSQYQSLQKVSKPKLSKKGVGKRKKQWRKTMAAPPDYGDRTQLSAFLLCLLLGFTGAHHFYMQNYKTGVVQLSFFVVGITLLLTNVIIGVAFGVLIGTALFAWVLADIFILVFRGMRTGKKKKLIPWED